MDDKIREKLKEIIQKEGLSVALKPQYLKKLLSNLPSSQQDKIDALLEMARRRLTWYIIQNQYKKDITKDKFKYLTTQLQKNSNIPEKLAQWAVTSWLEALKKEENVDKKKAATTAPTSIKESNLRSKNEYKKGDKEKYNLIRIYQGIIQSISNSMLSYLHDIEALNKKTANDKKHIQDLRERLKDEISYVERHIKEIGAKVPDVKPKRNYLHVDHPESSTSAYIKVVSEYSSDVCSSKNESAGNRMGCGTFIITFIVSVIIGSIVRHGGIGYFVGVLVFIVLTAIFYTKHFFNGEESYIGFYENVYSARFYLDEWEKKVKSDYEQGKANINQHYGSSIRLSKQRMEEFISKAGLLAAPWSNSIWEDWRPADSLPPFVYIGTLSSTVKIDNEIISVPAILPFSNKKGILVKKGTQDNNAIIRNFLQSVMLRLLATIPPGKLRFTFIDPVGLGENVSALMPLGDYDDSLINSKAWVDPSQIEKRLGEIIEHMENIIQKYLRDEFKTIEDYNIKAGEIAEPYHILVIFDFPVNFSETATRRLVSIVKNGARCGVHTFIVMDTKKPLPYGFNLSDLESTSTIIQTYPGYFNWSDGVYSNFQFNPDYLPKRQEIKHLLETTGIAAKDSMRVEVPFDKLLKLSGLTQDKWWQGSTLRGINIPLGPLGARKIQYLSLGQGTAQHALVVGRTGSGKSNLMHVIITAIALMYSPEEIQLYLIDFKKGVEFKPYASIPLPHARVIAIESEREFGLSVLRGLNEELKRRGDLFRSNSVNNIMEYRQRTHEKMARILLIVDEFQEFFTEDDNCSREAALILDRLARQGRAFGIHILLGSQTLAGAYSLARSTIDQMGVRIALQCSESDSRLILSDDNPAARLLSRPGEAVYNDHSGLVEGNNFFQIALLQNKDQYRYFRSLSKTVDINNQKLPLPIIFEGNEPAQLEKCKPLNNLFKRSAWPTNVNSADAYLGEPIAIQPPVTARFQRQSGGNLLIVTRNEEEGVSMLGSAILSIAAQYQPKNVQFFIVDLSTADQPWADLAEDIEALLPYKIEVLGRRDIRKLLPNLTKEINERLNADKPKNEEIFLILEGMHRARDLRSEEIDFGPSMNTEEKRLISHNLFISLIREGPEVGIHTLAWTDTYSNANRVLDRRTMEEFSMRVAGSMSNDDSLNFLDDSLAAKINKPHRFVFFDEEKPGVLRKFRPYSLPTPDLIKQIGMILGSRQKDER